ncbi:hypothetical protein, partial [Castellaniella sp. GW247-6E4]|uniref:hypothetical protein n=1 Tax=Castellaniella sp. GW247-6E4 TaxID=3140380 RepID=UPI003314C982
GLGGHDAGIGGHDAGIGGHDRPEYPNGGITRGAYAFPEAFFAPSQSRREAQRGRNNIYKVKLAICSHKPHTGESEARIITEHRYTAIR